MTEPLPVILVVDDEARNRALLASYLGSTCRVLEASDVPAALEILGDQPVDLVLLDFMMPGMDGFEGCRRIKAAYTDPYLPVLLVTASYDRDDRYGGLEAGADDFLTKPVDRRELLLRVRTFLRLRAQDRLIRHHLAELRRLEAQKDDLVAMLIHDLRNPLTGVMGMLEVVAAEVRDPELAQDLQLARDGASRVRDAVEDVLAARHIEEARFPVNPSPVHVATLLGRVVSGLAASARSRDVTLRTDAPEDLTVPADADLVRRALENLIVNAIRYSTRAAAVRVSARQADGGVELCVTDAGPGVPDALKGSLFDKFATSDAPTGGRRGFGYGLYLVRLVAEGHGGRVAVRDVPTGGAEFGLWLPLP